MNRTGAHRDNKIESIIKWRMCIYKRDRRKIAHRYWMMQLLTSVSVVT